MGALSLLLDAGKIENTGNFKLSDVSTFKVGGTAQIALFPKDESEMATVLAACAEDGIKVEIIGGASNVVFPERFDGAVIFTKNLCEITIENNFIIAGAGAPLNAVAVRARDASLAGFEFAFGIPGSVGGAVFMNAAHTAPKSPGSLSQAVFLTAQAEKFLISRQSLTDFHTAVAFCRKTRITYASEQNLSCRPETKKK